MARMSTVFAAVIVATPLVVSAITIINDVIDHRKRMEEIQLQMDANRYALTFVLGKIAEGECEDYDKMEELYAFAKMAYLSTH